MPKGVKPTPGVTSAPRRYNSPLRELQAAATRTRILDVAQTLFERDGYPPTTIEAIATEAGVAVKTVYIAFTTKSGLLRAVWDLLLKGDQDEAAVAARPWYLEVLNEPDPRQQLVLNAHNAVIVKQRIGKLLAVIRDAAPADDDISALWELIQSDFYDNQRVIVASLHKKKALKRGLSVTRATDIIWTLNHPDTWLLLAGKRGWTAKQFETWFAETTCAQLLKDASG